MLVYVLLFHLPFPPTPVLLQIALLYHEKKHKIPVTCFFFLVCFLFDKQPFCAPPKSYIPSRYHDLTIVLSHRAVFFALLLSFTHTPETNTIAHTYARQTTDLPLYRYNLAGCFHPPSLSLSLSHSPRAFKSKWGFHFSTTMLFLCSHHHPLQLPTSTTPTEITARTYS